MGYGLIFLCFCFVSVFFISCDTAPIFGPVAFWIIGPVFQYIFPPEFEPCRCTTTCRFTNGIWLADSNQIWSGIPKCQIVLNRIGMRSRTNQCGEGKIISRYLFTQERRALGGNCSTVKDNHLLETSQTYLNKMINFSTISSREDSFPAIALI